MGAQADGGGGGALSPFDLPDCPYRGVCDWEGPAINMEAKAKTKVPSKLCGAVDYVELPLIITFGSEFYNCPLLLRFGMCPEGWR